MKKYFFLFSLLSILLVPQGVSAKLNPPQNPTLPSVSERSASVHWDWTPGGGVITDFELLFGRKEQTAKCEDIKEWEFSFHPGKDERNNTVRGLYKLEEGQVYCWKIMARAVNPADSSEFAYGPEFRNKVVERGAICGENGCEAGEDPVSCPTDCKVGGGTPSTIGNPISATDIFDLLNKILNFLFALSIFIVPVIVIYAAFLMLMGGGDPVKLQKGRMILFWTAVAFILILVSRGLPAVFRNLL
jgi:hypothetical protein